MHPHLDTAYKVASIVVGYANFAALAVIAITLYEIKNKLK